MLVLTAGAGFAQNPGTVPAAEITYAEKLAADGYIELAIEQYRLFLQRYPENARVPEILRHIADGYAGLGRYADAREAYEKLFLRHPASPHAADALYQIARCFENEGDRADAARAYERYALMHASEPQSVGAFLRAGRLYLQLGDQAKGRPLLYKVIDDFPDNETARVEASLLLLQDFFATGELQRAFELANAYLRRFSEITATPKVWLIKADIHFALGQIPLAIEALQTVRSKYKNAPEARVATLRLARLYSRIGELQVAEQLLSELGSGSQDSLAVSIALLQAQIALAQSAPERAVAAFKQVSEQATLQPELALLLARSLLAAGDAAGALAHLEAVLAGLTAQPDSLRLPIVLETARAAFLLGNGGKARDYARTMLRRASEGPLRAQALLLLADIYFELFDDPARALRLYSEFLESYPNHLRADAAQQRLARCYERLQQWNLARLEWQRLQRQYPASTFFEEARRHERLIQRYYQPDLVTLAEGIAGLDGASQDADLRRVETHFRFRDYRQVIPLARHFIAREREGQEQAQAMFLLGSSYFALGDMAIFDQPEKGRAWLDSARVVLELLRHRYPDAGRNREIDRQLATILMRSQEPPLDRLDSLSAAYADDENFAGLHLFVLGRRLESFNPADTLAARSHILRLQHMSRASDPFVRNQATLLLARYSWGLGDTAAAQSHLQVVLASESRDPAVARALFLRANWLELSGKPEQARRQYERFLALYDYSPYADQALLRLAALAVKAGDYRTAIEWIEKLQIRVQMRQSDAPGDLPAEALLLRAQAQEKLGNDVEAAHAYLEFLRREPGGQNGPACLLALGKIAERMQTFDLAKKYYAEAFSQYDESLPQVLQAKFALAELEFRRENYKTARNLAIELLNKNLPPAFEIDVMKLGIIAELRMNSLQYAEAELKNFKKKFGDENEQYAEILFEKGDLYIRQKNFRQAEKIFKDLREDFAGTSFGIRGEFGYGKALLYQTKTEDALEILTAIPGKYPGHPFLRVVYLNLGEFYQDQQQWGNAIQAYHAVLADSIIDATHKAALAKLAELYESTGMDDAALAAARKYLQLFPDADGNLSMRMRVGALLRRLQLYDEAIEYYEKLLPLARGEDELAIRYFIGECYFDSGRYELAIGEFLKLRYENKPTKFPWKSTAIYKAGEAYLRSNNLARALEMFDYVVRMEGATSQMGVFALRKIAQIEEMQKSNPAAPRKS